LWALNRLQYITFPISLEFSPIFSGFCDHFNGLSIPWNLKYIGVTKETEEVVVHVVFITGFSFNSYVGALNSLSLNLLRKLSITIIILLSKHRFQASAPVIDFAARQHMIDILLCLVRVPAVNFAGSTRIITLSLLIKSRL